MADADFYPPPELAELAEELTCSICKQIFDGPVSLECGHVFCSGCIRQSFGYSHAQNQKQICPTCRDPSSSGHLRPVAAMRKAVLALPFAAAAVEALRLQAQEANSRAAVAEQEANVLRTQLSNLAAFLSAHNPGAPTITTPPEATAASLTVQQIIQGIPNGAAGVCGGSSPGGSTQPPSRATPQRSAVGSERIRGKPSSSRPLANSAGLVGGSGSADGATAALLTTDRVDSAVPSCLLDGGEVDKTKHHAKRVKLDLGHHGGSSRDGGGGRGEGGGGEGRIGARCSVKNGVAELNGAVSPVCSEARGHVDNDGEDSDGDLGSVEGHDGDDDKDEDYSPDASESDHGRGSRGARRNRKQSSASGGCGSRVITGRKRDRGPQHKAASVTPGPAGCGAGHLAPPAPQVSTELRATSEADASSAPPPARPQPQPQSAAGAAAASSGPAAADAAASVNAGGASSLGACPLCGSQYPLSQLQAHVEICLLRKGFFGGGGGHGGGHGGGSTTVVPRGSSAAGGGGGGATNLVCSSSATIFGAVANAGRVGGLPARAPPSAAVSTPAATPLRGLGLVGAAVSSKATLAAAAAAAADIIQVPPARNFHTMSLREVKKLMNNCGLPAAGDKQEMADIYNRYRSFLQTEKDRCCRTQSTSSKALLNNFLRREQQAEKARRAPPQAPVCMKAIIAEQSAKIAAEVAARRKQAASRAAASVSAAAAAVATIETGQAVGPELGPAPGPGLAQGQPPGQLAVATDELRQQGHGQQQEGQQGGQGRQQLHGYGYGQEELHEGSALLPGPQPRQRTSDGMAGPPPHLPFPAPAYIGASVKVGGDPLTAQERGGDGGGSSESPWGPIGAPEPGLPLASVVTTGGLPLPPSELTANTESVRLLHANTTGVVATPNFQGAPGLAQVQGALLADAEVIVIDDSEEEAAEVEVKEKTVEADDEEAEAEPQAAEGDNEKAEEANNGGQLHHSDTKARLCRQVTDEKSSSTESLDDQVKEEVRAQLATSTSGGGVGGGGGGCVTELQGARRGGPKGFKLGELLGSESYSSSGSDGDGAGDGDRGRGEEVGDCATAGGAVAGGVVRGGLRAAGLVVPQAGLVEHGAPGTTDHRHEVVGTTTAAAAQATGGLTPMTETRQQQQSGNNGEGNGEASWRGLLCAALPYSAAAAVAVEGLIDISNSTGAQRPGMMTNPGVKGPMLATSVLETMEI